MALRLTVRLGDEERSFTLADGVHRLGSSSDNDVVLADPTVSRKHAELRVDGQRLRVTDLGSSNGTRHEGKPVSSAELGPGQGLRFGMVEASVHQVAEREAMAGIRLDLASSAEPGAPTATLVPMAGSRFVHEHLPGVLARMGPHSDALALAPSLLGALLQGLNGSSGDIVRDQAVLARVEGNAGSVAEHQAQGFRIRVQVPDAAQAAAALPALGIATQLLRIADALLPAAPCTGARGEPPPLPEPATCSPPLRQLYAQAARIARSELAVLIEGESGTGKEVFADYLHRASLRADKPYVALNCAALPRDLLEVELFGIEDAVATGVKARPGKFEAADGGTLFLDEIGDMAADCQAKILRVLQDGKVLRIGARQARAVDVRIIAATNHPLQARIAEGSFRLDLYHRLADWSLTLPPLRQRREDIAQLAAWFLAAEARRNAQSVAGLSVAALDALLAYSWPGNVRELQREMARAALFLEPGQMLESRHLSVRIQGAQPGLSSDSSTLEGIVADAERAAIRHALSETASPTDAARRLGVSRSTLYRKLEQLKIEPG